MLIYILSVEVQYYDHYPNEWYDSYKSQLHELFKNEKGIWYIHSKWGYYCFCPAEIDSDMEIEYFLDKLETRIRILVEQLLNLSDNKGNKRDD